MTEQVYVHKKTAKVITIEYQEESNSFIIRTGQKPPGYFSIPRYVKGVTIVKILETYDYMSEL